MIDNFKFMVDGAVSQVSENVDSTIHRLKNLDSGTFSDFMKDNFATEFTGRMTKSMLELCYKDPYGIELFNKMEELAAMAGVQEQFQTLVDKATRAMFHHVGLKVRKKISKKKMKPWLRDNIEDFFDDIWPEIEH